ncbi:MAG: hypothetical protein GMKNLPBB_02605 [Myxococcota bacterium]|nr:hypothetical protein [Myxococcota bacterium]
MFRGTPQGRGLRRRVGSLRTVMPQHLIWRERLARLRQLSGYGLGALFVLPLVLGLRDLYVSAAQSRAQIDAAPDLKGRRAAAYRVVTGKHLFAGMMSEAAWQTGALLNTDLTRHAAILLVDAIPAHAAILRYEMYPRPIEVLNPSANPSAADIQARADKAGFIMVVRGAMPESAFPGFSAYRRGEGLVLLARRTR